MPRVIGRGRTNLPSRTKALTIGIIGKNTSVAMQQGPCTERARRLFSADRSVDLAARKLAQYDGGKRVPATVAAISDSSGYGFLLRPSLMSCSDAIFRALRTRNSSKVVWLCTSDAMLNLDKHSNAFWFSGQNPAAPRQHHHISEPYFFMSLRVVSIPRRN